MKWTAQPLVEFLAAVGRPDPTPGGGSASALAGALGASLLAMVASMPKHRAASDADLQTLRDSGGHCRRLASRLTELVDEDSRSYAAVVAAYRLPKGSEDEKAARSAQIQEALRQATDIPLAVMQLTVEGLQAARPVAAFGYGNAASDVGVALELLSAAHRGARLNVAINLDGIKDAAYGTDVRRRVDSLSAASEAAADEARARLPAADA